MQKSLNPSKVLPFRSAADARGVLSEHRGSACNPLYLSLSLSLPPSLPPCGRRQRCAQRKRPAPLEEARVHAFQRSANASPQSAIKSSFSTDLVFTTSRRIPASATTNEAPEKDDLILL